MRSYRIIFCAFVVLAVTGCGETDRAPMEPPERDPIVTQALNDRLMTDPDLAFQNEGNAALTVRFDHSIPPIDASPDTLALVREQSRTELLEEGGIVDLPTATEDRRLPSFNGVYSAKERARLVTDMGSCAESLSSSAIWAARLPDFAEPVPRGAVVDAAGSDDGACRLRVVTYRTPLPVEEALAFHFNKLERARLKPRHLVTEEGVQALQGAKGAASATIYARPVTGNLTELDIVTIERS